MEQFNITLAQYTQLYDEIDGIKVVINNETLNVPLDKANRHYAEIMRQVEEGTLVIESADEPETP